MADAASGAGFLGQEPTRHHALCRPDKLACVELATGARLTFRDLDARIANCAARLAALPGGALGARIAYLGRNSIDLVVLNFACHRAGAVFVPLNWRLTAAEVSALLAACAPALLVCDAEFEGTAREASGGVPVHERTVAPVFAPGAAPVPPGRLDAAAPCTLLFTSGTTGRPKAAIVTRSGAFFSALNFAFVG